jgi:hypothetical protein
MYVSPCFQCSAIVWPTSPALAATCGRQFAAPTQNVERHVATNSTMGSVTRRRGRLRKCDSESSGKFDQSRWPDAPRAGVEATGGLFAGKSFETPAPSAFAGRFGGDEGNCSGGSDGLDVLMIGNHTRWPAVGVVVSK